MCCCVGRGCRVNSSVVPANLLKLKLGILAATFISHSWYLELLELLLKFFLLFFFFSNLRIALKCRNFPLSVAHDFWLGAFSCVGFFFFSPSYHIGYWHFSVFRFTFLCDIWIISFSENTELWCHTGMYLIYSLSSPKLCLRALCLKYDSNDTYQFKFPRDSNSKETLYSMKFTKMKMPSLAWYCNWNKRVGR